MRAIPIVASHLDCSSSLIRRSPRRWHMVCSLQRQGRRHRLRLPLLERCGDGSEFEGEGSPHPFAYGSAS